MTRVLLGMVALLALSACGQTERERSGAMAMGGAGAGVAAGGGGAGSSSVGSSGADMGGLGGTAGSSHVQLAVAECERYCETLDYRLPGALCEDWNRPGWEPPFCRLGSTTSCADYCSKVYDALSPECGALLPPVIRCVAPTYANVNVPSLSDCWLGDCRDQLFTMTSACYGLKERLSATRATWEASGVVDYQLAYDLSDGLKAQVVVRAGREPAVTPPDAVAWTVPKLFDEVERYLHEPGVAPIVVYDAVLGYVVDLMHQQGCTEGSAVVSGVEVAPLR